MFFLLLLLNYKFHRSLLLLDTLINKIMFQLDMFFKWSIYFMISSLFLIFGFVLDDFFVKTINDGDGKQDTSSWSDGSQEISKDGQNTNAHTTQSGSGHDQSSQFSFSSFIGWSLQEHSLFLEVSSNFLWSLTWNINPSSRENGASSNHECNVNDCVNWWGNGSIKTLWWSDVINQTSDWDGLTLVTCFLPSTENAGNEWSLEVSV